MDIPDILREILSKLEIKELCRVSRVCKRWKRFIDVLAEKMARDKLLRQKVVLHPEYKCLSFFSAGGVPKPIKTTSHAAAMVSLFKSDIPWLTPLEVYQTDMGRVLRKTDMFVPFVEEEDVRNMEFIYSRKEAFEDSLILGFNGYKVAFDIVPILLRNFEYDPHSDCTTETIEKESSTQIVYIPVSKESRKIIIIPHIIIQFTQVNVSYNNSPVKRVMGLYMRTLERHNLVAREAVHIDSGLWARGNCVSCAKDSIPKTKNGKAMTADGLRILFSNHYSSHANDEHHPLFTPSGAGEVDVPTCDGEITYLRL